MCFRFLSYCNRLDLAERLLISGVEAVERDVRKMVGQEYERMLTKRNEQRCRILIPQSRLLFGVCDTKGLLKDGECVVRVTMDGDGQAQTIVGTQVLVTRNPCLHPGDLQKFRAVFHPELSHLVDCVVFPTAGKRPSADLMSGGDLDGDKCKCLVPVISRQRLTAPCSLRLLGQGSDPDRCFSAGRVSWAESANSSQAHYRRRSDRLLRPVQQHVTWPGQEPFPRLG